MPRGLYPEVESARLAARAVAAAVVFSVAAVAAVLHAQGVGAEALPVLAALSVVGAVLSWRAIRRSRLLEEGIRRFDAWCGGAERAARGASGVYYCSREGFIVCFDPLLGRVHVAAGRVAGSVEAPERPDYRCTLRVKGEASEEGGTRVFRGVLYAPMPGSPGRLARIEGFEIYAAVGPEGPDGAADKLLGIARRLGAGGAQGS
ncbi:hypothetical protein [Stetteria hydrogenophila]